MIAACADFVCAADEVWRLQRGSEADCVFFQRAVNGGERITDRGTRQGTWILAPGGRLLAHANTRDIERQLETMARGLAAFRELGAADRALPEGVELAPAHRWEDGFPEDGLALERVGREVGPEGLAGAPGERWNRDFAWFSAEELRGLLPASLAPGESVELPLVARRLARFHLVDNVRGQTLPFADAEVLAATLRATTTELAADGRVLLRLEGATRAEAAPEWLLGENAWTPNRVDPHGIACELLGDALWNAGTRTFERFDLVAVGRRWGRTVMNGRGSDDEPGVVAFRFAPTRERIAPAFAAVYDAEWLPRPAVPTWRESPAECGLGDE